MLIFDKSFLQAISLDESVWLEQFFLINITPLFYVEVLADLEKEVSEGNTPEKVVGGLANKTPIGGTFSNVHHHTLVVNSLLGVPIEMRRRPFVKGGIPKRTPDGKIGFFFDESPEDKALNRWGKREFLEIERETAKQWRTALSSLTFDALIGMVKNIVPPETHFSNLEQIKDFVDGFIERNDEPVLELAMIILDIPQNLTQRIRDRWKNDKNPPLNKFAPYASYVLSIDLFFYLALNSSFIAKEQPSNKIDLSYLYYLPFCMIFVSRDKLHKRVAPLFMGRGQVFADGDEFKAGLKELDEYYSKFQKEIEEQGVMTFAHYPPRDVDVYISRLWDSLGKSWRKDANDRDAGTSGLPEDEELLKHLKDLEDNAQPLTDRGQITSDDADHVTFTRIVPVQKGKWRILPKGIENKKNES